ncbi:hypothetical protein DF200_00405 [Bifidobacterium catulorum]|uniref:Uncharacterized protein n=1 Tax=Bifidobacterium catulorum TaxID=1630173 RepID=A0A2U2MV47_9BIFI|nr:hypothetical protein DF200_00405 [Bifidobacterium catulorum]
MKLLCQFAFNSYNFDVFNTEILLYEILPKQFGFIPVLFISSLFKNIVPNITIIVRKEIFHIWRDTCGAKEIKMSWHLIREEISGIIDSAYFFRKHSIHDKTSIPFLRKIMSCFSRAVFDCFNRPIQSRNSIDKMLVKGNLFFRISIHI